MTDTTYNGWVNWETWNAALWMDNEYDVYKERRRLQLNNPIDICLFFTSIFPNGTPDMDKKDVKSISWREISDNWNDEYKEN